MIRAWSVLIMVLVYLPTAWAADGDNKLSNGTFDTDIAGWTPWGTATVAWDPMDADGNISSGSVMITNDADFGTWMFARQCSDLLDGDQEYFVTAMVHILGGSTETGFGAIRVQFQDQPDCGGSTVGSVSSSLVYTDTPDQWLEASTPVITSPATQSAWAWLTVAKNEATGSLTMAFDSVSLFAAEIFADGFETGTTDAWSP